MNVVQLPISYFGQFNQGRPIFSGKVFIGVVDTDPTILANRVPLVLTQEDGTEVPIAPAAQPLELSAGGYFIFDGSPVLSVEVDGSYSMSVLDKNDAQVYYFPDVLNNFTTNNITHEDDSTIYNLEDYLQNRHIVNVKDSAWAGGAKGDGVTDDSAAIIAATFPNDYILFPEGVYRVASSLAITADCYFLGGAILKPDNGITITVAGEMEVFDYAQLFDLSEGGSVILSNSLEVNPMMWGAAGDNVRDDTVEVQQMFDSGRVIRDVSDHEYKITSQVTVPAPANAPLLDQKGTLKLRPDGSFTAVSFLATTTANTTLAVSTRIGRQSITVTSSAGMNVGDILVIVSDKIWPHTEGTYGETNAIAEISGNNITLATPVILEYVVPAETVNITTYSPKTVALEDLDVRAASVLDFASALDMFGISNSNIDKLTVRDFRLAGVTLNRCYNVNIDSLLAIDCFGTGFGYGLQTVGSTHITIAGGLTYRCRHGVDFSGGFPSHLCGVDGMTMVGHKDEGSCSGSHGTAHMCSYTNNVTSNSPIAFQCRGSHSKVSGNTSFAHNTFAFIDAEGYSVTDNRVAKAPENSTPTDTNFAYFVEIDNNIVTPMFSNSTLINCVSNNEAEVSNAFIRFRAAVTQISHLTVQGNTASVRNNNGGTNTAFMEASSPAVVDDSTTLFKDNIVKVFAGVYEKYRNLTWDHEVTISGGTISPNKEYVTVDTQADAASDDLDTISSVNYKSGDTIVLSAQDSSRTVVCKDGTGNLSLNGDFSLNNTEDTIALLFNGSVWNEISRSDNGA